MLEPKLERYIKNCYPPGNGSEKHAKPSELSYVMYYLQTHRSRIAHAARVLQGKLDRQVTRQNKLGNAVVTLEIARELVMSCKDDLNVFAQAILEMAQVSLAHSEFAIAIAGCQMFEVFAQVHDGMLFTDNTYTRLFLHVVDLVAQMATKKGSDTQIQREVALKAIGMLVQSPCINSETGLRALAKSVPALYQDARGSPIEGASGNEALALTALRTLFGSEASVLAQTTDAVLSCSMAASNDHQWVLRLLDHAANWAQVQLRFTIPKVVLKNMTAHPDHASGLADYMLVLLRSPVSMVGLDVRVTLATLVDLQRQTANHEKLRQCISALAAHIVYPGQGNDMLNDLLARYTALPEATPDVREEDAICDMNNIQAIIGAGHLERLVLSPWIATQWLLNRSDGVIVAYTNAFGSYIIASQPENPKAASQLARQFCQVLLHKNQPGSYISAYYCLERLVSSLGESSVLLAPVISQLQDAGLRNGSGGGSNGTASSNGVQASASQTGFENWQVCASLSAAQALLLGISRAAQRKSAEKVYFNGIGKRVEIGAWFRGIICPSNGVPIETAVTAARKSLPEVTEYAPELVLSIDELCMTEAETAQAAAFDAPIDETVPLGALEIFKTRARSLADSITTSGDQRILSRVPSTQIDAPTVSQLRRRATSSQTSIATRNNTPAVAAMAPASFKPSEQLTGMLGNLKVSETDRGRLVV